MGALSGRAVANHEIFGSIGLVRTTRRNSRRSLASPYDDDTLVGSRDLGFIDRYENCIDDDAIDRTGLVKQSS
jgi:hypothetical protein